MILCLDSASHFKNFEFYKKEITYCGSIKLLLGLINLNSIEFVFYTVENSFINICASHFLNKKGIKTILFIDGVFEWQNSYHNLNNSSRPVAELGKNSTTYVCCNDITLSYLNKKGNFMKFVNTRVTGNTDETLKSRLPDTKKILITTAKNPYFNNKEKERLINILREIILECKKSKIISDVRFFDSSILNALQDLNVTNQISENFHNTAINYSAIITTPSSISIECMRIGKRVGHIIHRDVPITIPSAWYFHGSMDIQEGLFNILNKEDTSRDLFQDTILKEHVEDLTPFIQCIEENSVCKQYRKRFKFYERLDFIWRLPYEIFLK